MPSSSQTESIRTYRSVSEWFAAQAAATPHTLAIVDDEQRLTYADLDSRSNEIALWLQFVGVNSESVVGLCTSHSVSFAIGALGILKSGAAYLPIDPELPADRQSFQLNDCGTHILVSEEKRSGGMHKSGCSVTMRQCDGQNLNGIPIAASHRTTSERLAYVIYTSGSTGAPKGVEVTEANLLNLITWHQEAFAVTPADRATQLAGLGFDAAVWELWPYLTAGASVHFVPEDIRTDPARLRDWLVAHEITIAFVPTALTEMLLTLDWPSQPSLRVLLTGADALHRYPPKRLPFQLVNNYGPTECTVVATSGIVPAIENCKIPPPIGRPIRNASCHLLDEQLQQVATGEVGELYIGGAGVARGYRNRSDLTAERFVFKTFDDGRPERLYRTGDLAYILSDGQLAFVGRVDEQIKLSGYRIEPNEIVHALQSHPAVQSACVVAREDTPGAKRLVGYVVSTSGVQCTEAELRQFLQQRLPSYMIPATFVVVDRFPQTSNGKVDRSALPAPDFGNTLRDAPLVAPRTPLEERLTAVLSQLLGFARISVEDNFFFLGGHSLMAAQLINKIRDYFDVDLPLKTVFEAPTISKLSLEVEKILVAKLESMSEEEAERLEAATFEGKEIAS
jgi:amino acid adenylation domain-containing protein